MSREILFVVGATEGDEGDDRIHDRLVNKLYYDVEVIAGRKMLNHHLMNKELVVISSTAAKHGDGDNVIKILLDAPIPVLVLGIELLRGLRMAVEAYANGNAERTDYLVRMGGGFHPLAAGLNEDTHICKSKRELFCVEPYKSFYEIAELLLTPEQKWILSDGKRPPESLRSICLYGYEAGDAMFVEGRNKERLKIKEMDEKLKRNEADLITAPARRVAYIFDNVTPMEATREGWAFFDAAVGWAVALKTPFEIFTEEWSEVERRRKVWKTENDKIEREEIYEENQSGIRNGNPPENLVGLALSGGGIRSATFSLGLLQGFHKQGLLRIFDYLSTVSGGGYLGGWWSAWLSRKDTRGLFPRGEKLETHRANKYLSNKKNSRIPEGSMCAEDEDPIHHLRLFGNYLTPRKGALSIDTWGAVAYISRNLMLTWLSLLPLLFSFVLIGQFYFLLQKNSAREYLYPLEIRNYESMLADPPKDIETYRTYRNQRDDDWEVEHKNNARIIVRHLIAAHLDKFLGILSDRRIDDAEHAEIVSLLTDDLKNQLQDRLKKKLSDLQINDPEYTEMENTLTSDFQPKLQGMVEELLSDGEAQGSVKPEILDILAMDSQHKLQGMLQKARGNYKQSLWARAQSTLFVLLPIVGLIILMSMAWMRSNVTKRPFMDWLAHTFASLVLLLLVFCILCLIDPKHWHFTFDSLGNWTYPVSIIFWAVMGFALYLATLPKVTELEWRKEIRKNKINLIHANLLILLVMMAFFLALSAFGYDLVNYILLPLRQGTLAEYIGKVVGWLTLIASILGSIFTAVKSAPSGGEDKNTADHLTSKSKFILFITPPLVLLTFTILLSWIARRCIYALFNVFESSYKINSSYFVGLDTQSIGNEKPFIIAVISSIILGFFFAIYELKKWKDWKKPFFGFLGLLGVCVGIGLLIRLIPLAQPTGKTGDWMRYWLSLFTVAFFIGAILCFRLFLFRKQRLKQINELKLWQQIGLAVFVALILAVAFAFITFWLTKRSIRAGFPSEPYLNWNRSSLSMAGIVFCFIAICLEMKLSLKSTGRSAYLLTGAYAILLAFLVSSFFSNPEPHLEICLAYLTLALLTLSLGWTIAIGWMSDPNWLSMHLFYKARLVRAYLGASNPNRKIQEITESAIGDDILMYDLTNCRKGAPYHLVNTTLNLIGAKDLATAQRSSSYFVLSKLYSGSLRTGYRRTREYMDGRFTLGTAVSVSGAAISPNMGAKTQTAALSMLMTLLNVRLGFWAPTPNNGSWRSPNPRLWPFYTLREFLSQTNDLGSYCYLTDGGHFDNTGLYSLVERGCRFIIISDNGADPLPCFEDLGDAIRRCRIDFDAEIDLDISPFFKKKDEASGDELAKTHYVVGTVNYSDAHLKKLKWSEEDRRDCNAGIIILIKPSLMLDEKADLRQFARQNRDFPQQTTGDQWFDEAQFESYRRLGEECATKVLEDLGLSTTLAATEGKLTPRMVACAFKVAKQIYDEHLENGESTKDNLEIRKTHFRGKMHHLLNPNEVKVATQPLPISGSLLELD
jgi:hypothetical protein